jgi:hypothetical protein
MINLGDRAAIFHLVRGKEEEEEAVVEGRRERAHLNYAQGGGGEQWRRRFLLLSHLPGFSSSSFSSSTWLRGKVISAFFSSRLPRLLRPLPRLPQPRTQNAFVVVVVFVVVASELERTEKRPEGLRADAEGEGGQDGRANYPELFGYLGLRRRR